MQIRRAVLLSVAVAATASAQSPPQPDLILHNARVYTLSWADPSADGRPAEGAPWDATRGWRPDASAVAVRDGQVLYVGTNAGALALRGEATKVVDLANAVLLPGMVDSHTHVAELGQSLDRINLTGIATEAEAVERVVRRATNTPKGEWILGWGWDEGAWANRYPDKRLLSERVPDHPVVLRGLHGFAAWANERALVEARVGPDTQSPVGGEIRRGSDGAPNGLFINRAVGLIDSAVPQPSAAQREAHVVRALRVMAEAGYTSVHEAGTPRATVEAMLRLDAKGALPIRVYAMLDGRDPKLLQEWGARGPLVGTEKSNLTIRSVKAYYDGALGSRGAQLLTDYSDFPGSRGISGTGYGFDHESVAAIMAKGFQVGIHAIGDAGNRASLDFIDSVGAASPGPRGLRHRIEHAQVIHPVDLQRFAKLGIIASAQPPHAVEDMPWAADRLGPERVRLAYAWRALLKSGARLVFSSDLPGSDWDLFYGLSAAVFRQDKTGTPTGGWHPDQRMTAEEAVRGYSTWAAYASFDETAGGSIAVGKRADFTAISVDPFRVQRIEELLKGKVRLTVVRGRVIESGPMAASTR